MLGFDCKWTPKARLPVAALQLSSHEGLCLVFRLNVLKIVPPELKVNGIICKKLVQCTYRSIPNYNLNFIFFCRKYLKIVKS